MPSHPARSAATLAAVLSLAVASVGPVAASLATSALAPGVGATQTSARVAPHPVAAHPVAPTVATYPVPGVSQVGLSALGRTGMTQPAPSLAALSAPEPASGVAVTGATWRGSAPPGLRLAIRTETDGRWSPWSPVPYDAEHGPTPGSTEARNAVPGTDPFVVGMVDQVQLKAVSDTGRAPAGLRLSVIDPGSSSADTPAAVRANAALEDASEPLTSSASPPSSTSPSATVGGVTPIPQIYSRADWGADEGMRDCCVEYGEVHAGFVHHTVNSNNYTRAEVPAILRGIYAYHTQSRGWRDIGYNFLIDRFGRIWEGRYGGETLPVVGAHTLNYNENSFAASAIGNFQIARPTSAMLNAYERLYAWKLSLHGVRPDTTQVVAGTTFNAISGHRDAAQTACPGIHLYKKIPTIIAKATEYQRLYRERELQHSVAGSLVPDVVAVGRDDGALSIAVGTGAPGFEPRQVVDAAFGAHDQVVGVGDVTGDGVNDVMARDPATGKTTTLRGARDGTLTPLKVLSSRWSDSDLFAGVGDANGDGFADVVARDTATGALLLYLGRESGGFAAATTAVASFAGFDAIAPAGDFDRDGDVDLLARGSAGRLWVYLGDGTGAFPSRLALPGNWAGKDLIAGGADLTGDRRPDIVARSASLQRVRIFANVGGVGLSPALGDLQTPMTTMSLSRDLTGDRRPDVVATTPRGALVIVPARRQDWLATPTSSGPSLAGVDRVMVVGDWDGDGYVDAMARRNGRMWLYPGSAAGKLGAPVGGWKGWGGRSLITPVGDWDGDGLPDVMARAPGGHVYLYPGRGMSGFKAPVIMRSSLPGATAIVAAGRWDGDGAPDVLVATARGDLQLYRGNGPGGLEDPVVVAHGFDRYNTLVGVGDLTGDGQPDLVGRTDGGDVWMLPGLAPSSGHPRGSLDVRQYLASGWSTFRIA
ncbi:MAG TPA: FG-GAP-like repeat-containing protein [Nocardioidaceae bacterium]|nr:FG-GAP-like repeat-containing protein [Nocardioidaceae bacterium]